MQKKLSLCVALLSTLYGESLDINTDGSQLRALYLNNETKHDEDTHTTALGGILKTQSDFGNFSLGTALHFSSDISPLSSNALDSSVSGDKRSYAILGEAYIGYKDIFKVGRQVIDTPYADSDDIRMNINTFEALTLHYELQNLTLYGGYLKRWQGVDTGEDDFYKFRKLFYNESEEAHSQGVLFASLGFEFESLEGALWVYYVEKMASIIYGEASYHHVLSKTIEASFSAQFANQEELKNSGIGANMVGMMGEVAYQNLYANVAYDRVRVENDKEYFSGFGGGSAFVNSFETTASFLSIKRSVDTYRYSAGYSLDDFAMEYSFGDYRAKSERVDVNEHNLVLSYDYDSINNELTLATIDHNNKTAPHNTDKSYRLIMFRLTYSF